MTKALLLFALLLSISLQLYCVNHMDLIFMMQGTTAYGNFGAGLAALDFNGDGYDDLAVLQAGWVPDSLITNPPTIMYGRILIYYGGPGFDSVADFIISGTYNSQFAAGAASYIVSLGDVNGDGYDDLSARGYTNYSDILADSHKPYVAAYFGGQNPSTQPGYYKSFPVFMPGETRKLTPWEILIMMGMMISITLIEQTIHIMN